MPISGKESFIQGPDFAPERADIYELFSQRALEAPEKIAVTFGDETLSYAELLAASDSIASALESEGVQPDDVIAVSLPRGIDIIVTIIAVISIGCVYVPLNPNDPAERLTTVLNDCSATIVIAKSGFRLLSFSQARVVDLRRLSPSRTNQALRHFRESARLRRRRRVACILYTSGSTGIPKGVRLGHMGIISLVRGSEAIAVQSDDVVAQFSSLGFDAASFEIWSALLNGATLAVIDGDTLYLPRNLIRRLQEKHVSVALLTTAVFNIVAADNPTGLGCLRMLLFGGEAADDGHVRRVLAATTGLKLLNCYGPTEASTITSVFDCRRLPDATDIVPIGTPISGRRMSVRDASLAIVPTGQAGEICIGGVGLAHGYTQVPKDVDSGFLRDPLSSGKEMIYCTGDRGVLNQDGQFVFLGRKDGQIKFRGHRIEPHEVEAAIMSHPAVREAAVVKREVGAGERLVAFVAGGSVLSYRSLREHVGRKLPGYMQPNIYIIVPELPLTAHGKIDRRSLEQRKLESHNDSRIGPKGDSTSLLVRDILGRHSRGGVLGANEDFFDAGGDSLSCLRAQLDLERELKRNLPDDLLYRNRTSAAILYWLERASPLDTPSYTRPNSYPTAPYVVQIGAASSSDSEVWCLLHFSRDVTERAVNSNRNVFLIYPSNSWDVQSKVDVEYLADQYITALGNHINTESKAVVIAGYSFGAIVAHEIGVKLANCNNISCNIVLVDPPHDGINYRFNAANPLSDLRLLLLSRGSRLLAAFLVISTWLGIGVFSTNNKKLGLRRFLFAARIYRYQRTSARCTFIWPSGTQSGAVARGRELWRSLCEHRANEHEVKSAMTHLDLMRYESVREIVGVIESI